MGLPLQLKPRNAALDSFFYDSRVLTEKQRQALLERTALEGSIIVTWPDPSEKIDFCDTAEAFLAKYKGKRNIDTITIAGVGSSDLGTAAFAKGVANGLGRPAIGIVTGYGLVDLMADGMGGFFWLGMRNRMQSLLDYFSGAIEGSLTDLMLGQNVFFEGGRAYVPSLPECRTLIDLLSANQDRTRFLVGHSKGNLSIANSLAGLGECADHVNHDMAIITFGCGVRLPKEFQNVHQYVGTLDLLGIMNTPVSEADEIHWLPLALHHINPATPGNIDMVSILEQMREKAGG